MESFKIWIQKFVEEDGGGMAAGGDAAGSSDSGGTDTGDIAGFPRGIGTYSLSRKKDKKKCKKSKGSCKD